MYDENEDEFNQEDLQEENEDEFNQEDLQEETEEIIQSDDVQDESSQEEGDDLPFAKAEVVRLMKQNLDSDKMIRERVKVEMNKFLGEVLVKVCEQLNEYPYTTIEYEMLKESIYPYQNIERINEEKKRILMHLHAIKADCDALSMDVKRTLKLKDVAEEESDIPFMD
ncbi:MAG: hypothetical protein PHQ17_06645 [Methanobacterium sp.]|jgi:histone H3/H4|nr:hypothetical protein [Methanobacterium sp.]